MRHWQHQIKIAPDMKAYREKEITFAELATRIAAQLENLKLDRSHDPIYGEIIERFQEFAAENNTDVAVFDGILETLYDWGDEWVIPGIKRYCDIGAWPR